MVLTMGDPLTLLRSSISKKLQKSEQLVVKHEQKRINNKDKEINNRRFLHPKDIENDSCLESAQTMIHSICQSISQDSLKL